MKGLKVCILTIEYPPEPGGVGQSVWRISRLLNQTGVEVHIAVFQARKLEKNTNYIESSPIDRKHIFDKSYEDGIHVYRANATVKTETNPAPQFLSDIFLAIKELHREHTFDLFHAFYLNETGFLATLLANEFSLPVINSVRGSDMHKNIFNSRHLSRILWILQHSSWVTFVSRELEICAQALAPSIKERTSTFWNSAAAVDFTKLSKLDVLPHTDGILIGAVGRFCDKKGTDVLIEACEKLAKDVKLNLLLVGDFIDKEKKFWQDYIRKSKINDRITLTGMLPREQALRYYPLMDIFVIPSIRDGCPNTLIEAAMSGKTIIGSDVDAIGEIIEHEVNGLKVKPGDSDEICEAMRLLTGNVELKHRLASNARRTYVEKLSPEVECNNWVNIYKKVLAIK